MAEAQQQILPQGVQLEGNDLESLLQKEFKPKTNNATSAIQTAVKTLAEVALASTNDAPSPHGRFAAYSGFGAAGLR